VAFVGKKNALKRLEGTWFLSSSLTSPYPFRMARQGLRGRSEIGSEGGVLQSTAASWPACYALPVQASPALRSPSSGTSRYFGHSVSCTPACVRIPSAHNSSSVIHRFPSDRANRRPGPVNYAIDSLVANAEQQGDSSSGLCPNAQILFPLASGLFAARHLERRSNRRSHHPKRPGGRLRI